LQVLDDVPELIETPFFPQTEYDCGPAALATILGAARVDVSLAELTSAVYIEGLKGSLQAELLAATRRHGVLPVPVGPDMDSLLAEVASGRPVLVLQNLGLKRAPAWHYAVVVGFDASTQRVILRSGAEPRRRERLRAFLRSWALADHWGFVAAQAGEIPVTADADRYMRVLIRSRRQLGDRAVDAAYEAALERWPDDVLVLFAAAVREHGAGNWSTAAHLYRQALLHDSTHEAAHNNLAHVLLAQGCHDAALREARLALSYSAPDSEFRATIADTVQRIETSQRADSSTACGTG
jgi:hypothetical protein